MIIAPPKATHPGAKTDALVELLDVYPTVAELCGLPDPKVLEGTSLVPLLKDPKATVKQAAYTQHPRPAYYKGKPKAMGCSVRTAGRRYTEWRDFETGDVLAAELYDHDSDPRETKNVAGAADRADEVNKLAAELGRVFPRKQ